MTSNIEFDSSYEYTPALAARMARRCLRFQYGGFLITLIPPFLFGIYLMSDHAYHWLSGFLCGAVFSLLLSLINWYRAAVGAARIHAGDPISIHLDSGGLRLSSSLLTSASPWQSIAAVHRIPEGLLLSQRGSAHLVPIPMQALTPESIAFIMSCVRAAGGRIGKPERVE
jgi:hypothetical protein